MLSQPIAKQQPQTKKTKIAQKPITTYETPISYAATVNDRFKKTP